MPKQDTTYPREGTETLFGGHYMDHIVNDTTYPREGTETARILLRSRPLHDTTYPREGTETYLSS